MISGLLEKLFGGDDEKIKNGSPRNVKHSVSEIEALLKQYQTGNHLLTAVFISGEQKNPPKYTTGILSIEAKQKLFITDEFMPREANEKLRAGTAVQFSLSHQGTRHQFNCIWKKYAQEPDGFKHWFEYPKGVEQVQLRDSFRVKMSQAHPIKVALTHAEKPSLAGTIADISASGIRVRIHGLIKPKPTRGETFTSCHLVLSDGSPIVCGARLMHWQFDPDQDTTFLGIHFEHMDGSTQRNLNRYLTEIQRKQRHIS